MSNGKWKLQISNSKLQTPNETSNLKLQASSFRLQGIFNHPKFHAPADQGAFPDLGFGA
jgi:hypothetical protein